MNEAEEQLWIRGRKAAYEAMLGNCLRAIGIDDPIAQAAAYLEERIAVIAYLRRVCGEIGDNDWPDNLHLSDIIEKHLIDYLDPISDDDMLGEDR